MQLSHHDAGDVRLIEVGENRIDSAVAIQFRDKMRTLTEDAPQRVVLDLSQVEFLDSSGLGAVVGAMKQVGDGRSLELAGLTPAVARVFALTRMDSVFRLHASAEDALGGDLANAG